MPIKIEYLQNQIESNIRNTVWYHESNQELADVAIDVCVKKSLAELVPIIESMERSVKSHEDFIDRIKGAMSILCGLCDQ